MTSHRLASHLKALAQGEEIKMTLTIYEGYDKSYVTVSSKDERFTKEWGSFIRVPASAVYRQLADISKWVNNELEEECLFEID